jgi:hypothetical protein
MKIHSPKTYLLTLTVILATAVIIINIYSARAQNPQAQNGSKNKDQEEMEVLRRGGYKELAKIKGHHVGDIDPNWDWSLFNTEELTKNSIAVVVGIPIRSQSKLSSSGQSVITEYEVGVQEVIKGEIKQGDTIKVSLPGGKVVFEDGTSVELNTPGFERMVNHDSYVLFLYAKHDGGDAYLLTGGPQGLFELPSDGASVKPHGRSTDPAVKEAQGKKVQSFLEEVRSQAKAGHKSQWHLGT